MTVLAGRIADLIAMQGPISLADFMSIGLHDPQLGYYASRDPLGAAGDFITAPEMSQMFGELLAAWIIQAWHDQATPRPACLVELGPGRGTLMADVLRTAKLDPEFLSGIEVVLVESSARLREEQAEKLAGSGPRVRWIERVEHAITPAAWLVLANEFFDALPIRQFVFTEQGWRERMVGLDEKRSFTFALSPVPIPLDVPLERGEARVGDVYEVCPSGEAIMEQIAGGIAQNGGAALIVDYGYGGDAGFGETFQAVSRHRFATVLDRPGQADLSAHVDFGALARAAERAGARAYGPASQGAVLERLGIRVRAEHLARKNPQQADDIAAAMDRLISPEQMGTLFKALAVLPKDAPKPAGF